MLKLALAFGIGGIIIITLSGCSPIYYSQVNTGELTGSLVVKWIEPDKFIFEPTDNPLTFVRSNGQTIVPQRMYTDGGSVPRAFQVFKNYSPWGYAPAFIMHDWLFTMKYCQMPGYEDSSLEEAADIMSEVVKTMMVKLGTVDTFALYTMDRAVRSPIAREVYESGKCKQPPAAVLRALRLRPALMQYEIKAPQ